MPQAFRKMGAVLGVSCDWKNRRSQPVKTSENARGVHCRLPVRELWCFKDLVLSLL